MNKPHRAVGVIVSIELLEEMQAARGEVRQRTGRDLSEDSWDILERELWRALGSIDGAEVCLNHQCWIKFYPRAATWRGIAAETERMRARLFRAVRRATEWSVEK